MMKKTLFFIAFIIIAWQISAQCHADRHSTTWYDGWISCDVSPNPNSTHGDTHWIQYDLGFEYTIFGTKFWNTNDPANLNNGIQDYAVDYSINGTDWTSIGSFTAIQATGLSTYEGDEGPDFGQITARYILITPTSNYGGSCYGFSEIRFDLVDNIGVDDLNNGLEVTAYPNPFVDSFTLIIQSDLTNEPIHYAVYDLLGRTILKGQKKETNHVNSISFDMKDMHSGLYFVKITQADKKQTVKVFKK